MISDAIFIVVSCGAFLAIYFLVVPQFNALFGVLRVPLRTWIWGSTIPLRDWLAWCLGGLARLAAALAFLWAMISRDW